MPTGRARTRGILGERENEERSCQKTGAGERVSGNVFVNKMLSEWKTALNSPRSLSYSIYQV